MIRSLFLPLAIFALILAACGGDDDDSIEYTGEPIGRIVFSSDRDGNEDVFIMGADGSEPTNLSDNDASDNHPSVNAAGDSIAFVSNRGGRPDIWMMAIDGSDQTQVTDDTSVAARPIWSPDGTQIAYYSSQDTQQGLLWVTEVSTGGSGPLLATLPNDGQTPCYGGTPTQWRTDDALIYQGTQANISATQMCSLNPNDFTVQVILGAEDATFMDGVISPDGTKIAYVMAQFGNQDIFVANIDGTLPVRLTFDPGNDSWPVWSPDGQWIAFSSERDGDAEIYLMRPDGEDLRQLTDNEADDFSPVWFD